MRFRVFEQPSMAPNADMREILEVRLIEAEALAVLDEHTGTLISGGPVRLVKLPIDDPAWSEVRAAEVDGVDENVLNRS